MNVRERTCYIHIGTHKTGSTSIQAFLALNRNELHAAGVLIPIAGSDGDPGVATHHALARELNAIGSCAVRNELRAMSAELRESTATTACLSSEDFTFLWDKPAVLAAFRDAIVAAGFTPRIIVFLRPQVPYVIAIYAENVRHGYRKPFREYLKDVLTHGHYVWGEGIGPPFDYGHLLDPFATAFGRDAILAQTYRATAPSASLLSAFARSIRPARLDVSRLRFPVTRYNGSLDFGGVLTALGLQHTVSDRLRFSPMNVAQTLRVGQHFRRANTALVERYDVKVPTFEPLDLLLALPIRKTRAKTRELVAARRILARAPASDIGNGKEMIVNR